MARVETIIVGGGVGGVAPFTLNGIPYVSNTDPAAISTTDFLSVVPTGATRGLIVGAADPDATATERLRVAGGAIIEGAGNESVCIGRGASATATGGVSIGRSSANTGVGVCIGNASSSASSGVVIGGTCSVASTICVVIGGSLSGGSSAAIVIGGAAITSTGVTCVGGASEANATNATVYGAASKVDATGGVAVGAGAVVAAGHTNSMALGACTTFAAQQLNIGTNASAAPITSVCIGGGLDTSSTAQALLIRMTNRAGTDLAGGNLTLQPSIGTGNAVAGNFIVKTGDQVAGSSTTLQTITDKLIISGGVTDQTLTLLAPGTRNVRINWTQGGTVFAVTGVTGVAHGIITNATAGDFCIRSVNKDILLSTDDGANIMAKFDRSAVARDTRFMIWDVDNGALERVSVGIADSGGVGFKLLRVPN